MGATGVIKLIAVVAAIFLLAPAVLGGAGPNAIGLLIVGAVAFLALRSGGGGAMKVIGIIVMVLVLVPSCLRTASDVPGMLGRAAVSTANDAGNSAWDRTKGVARSIVCSIVRITPICDIEQISKAPDAAQQTRLQCIDRKAGQTAEGRAALQVCSVYNDDPAQRETCMNSEFDKVPALQGTLIDCSAGSPSQLGPFLANLIEPFVCLFGIKALCETSTEPATPASTAPRYDLTCVADRFNTNLGSVPDRQCRDRFTDIVIDEQGTRRVVRDPEGLYDCMATSLVDGLGRERGEAVLATCPLARP